MSIRFDAKVAIVTGAGGGLGRQHALALAARGAKVVVNDLGGARDGTGGSVSAAQAVVDEIEAAGGEAMANGASVTECGGFKKWSATSRRLGAGRYPGQQCRHPARQNFAKMTLDDFRQVLDVHLMGSVNCTKAVWEVMRDSSYGRIVMTTSSTGLYGNFGQTNYGAAKMALVGLMKHAGARGREVRYPCNALAPAAGTRMTEGLFDQKAFRPADPRSRDGRVAGAVRGTSAEPADSRRRSGWICQCPHLRDTGRAFDGGGPDARERARVARADEPARRPGGIHRWIPAELQVCWHGGQGFGHRALIDRA